MMKKEKKMIFTIIICTPMLFLFLDLINVRDIIPVTDNYDWLGFVGSCLSAFGALTLGLISIKQNESLSDLNKKMLNNDMISNCYSKISACKKHYFDEIKKDYKDDYGYEVINDNIKKSKQSYYRFIFQIKDQNELPLTKGNVSKVTIQYNPKDNWYEKEQSYSGKKQKEVKLEVTPFEEETYYLPISIIDEFNNLEEIFYSDKLRITLDMAITNSLGVKNEFQYTLVLSRTNTKAGTWYEYHLNGKKVYYGKVSYIGD